MLMLLVVVVVMMIKIIIYIRIMKSGLWVVLKAYQFQKMYYKIGGILNFCEGIKSWMFEEFFHLQEVCYMESYCDCWNRYCKQWGSRIIRAVFVAVSAMSVWMVFPSQWMLTIKSIVLMIIIGKMSCSCKCTIEYFPIA